MNNKLFSALLLSPILCTNLYINEAMSAAEEAVPDASIVSYGKDYFVNYSPVTLLDMLQSVPGVSGILNQNRRQNRGGGASSRAERGFGSGGDQILIDGKRLAGKTNNINDTLSRISASSVERIELIRGASSGLDVQSEGLVINIVMLEGLSTSTTFWEIKGEYSSGHNFVPEFLISHSGSLGSLDYSLSAERNDNDFFFTSEEEFYDKNDVKFADQSIDGGFGREGYKFNTNLGYQFEDESKLRLNGLYEPSSNGGQEIRSITTNILNPVLWDTDRQFDKWEIGGDYTRNVGVLGDLKTLFVINRNKEDGVVHRSKGSGSEKFEYVTERTNENKSEKIFRGSLTKNITVNQSLEIGGEAALNTFEKTFNRSERDTAVEAFAIVNSDNVEIKENRYEVFANHSYNISPKIVLQSSLTTEFSKIIADNIFPNGALSRRDTSFTYIKPRINLRYDYTDQDQIRATVEKKVSQLDFDNFVTEFDQQSQEFKFGNTNIRPEQVWEFSLAYEHRFPNDSGSLEGEVFYRRYTDHISTVDFTEYLNFTGSSIDTEGFFNLPTDAALRSTIDFSAKQGNINKATAHGVKLKSNIRFGFIGVPQAVLSLGYTYEKRRTTDQFTQLIRNFDRGSDHSFTFNFRHDITDLGFTYGFEGDFRSDYANHYLNYFWPNSPAANIKVFAEYNIFQSMKVRIEGEGLTRNRGRSTFFSYNDHLRLNDLKERQEKDNKRPVELRISLQGTF
jgi:outer membrane receptor for ferrienterochelin and colicins